MSHELLIENIKTRLPHIEPALLHSIWEVIEHGERRPQTHIADELVKAQTLVAGDLHFIGENPPFDPQRDSSLQERAALKRRLKTQNQAWLLLQFEKLQAAWLMVVDRQVAACGATLASYPKPEKILETCRQTGKFPFLFVNEDHLSIEEGGTRWPQTIIPDDYYPTIVMTLHSGRTTAVVIGDFDTGASSTFVDYDWLVEQNLIQLQVQEDAEYSHHLNQVYEYLPRSFEVEIASKSRKAPTLETTIACVANWQESPFVKVNPVRAALIGRDVCFKLKPRLLLDFDARQTEIQSKRSVRTTASKSAKAKSSLTKRRKRS